VSVSIAPFRVSHLWERPARQPKHSAPAEVERLRGLLDGAHALIKGQGLQLDDKDRKIADVETERDQAIERYEIAEKERDQAEAINRLRDQQIANLARRLDIACQANAAADMTQEIDTRDLRNNYGRGVLTLQQAHGIGPVRDPGRVYGEEVAS
jgi:hypothetical protein